MAASNYGGKTLPDVVLVGLDRNESKTGRIAMWSTAACFALAAGLFFAAPEPMAEKLATVPYVVAAFAVIGGYFFWLSRKRLRLHRLSLARVLMERPADIESIAAESVVPRGNAVARAWIPLNADGEFRPLPETVVRILGFKMYPRTWVYLKIKGKIWRRKLIVPRHQGPELLSWLFATLAAANPDCKWGTQTLRAWSSPD